MISEGESDQDSIISGDQWLNTINKIGQDKTTSNGGTWTENKLSNWQWGRYKHKFQEICKTYVRKEQVQPTSVNLRMWNKSTMQPLGETILAIWQIQGQVYIIVVSSKLTCLLSLTTIQDFGLVTNNNKHFIANVNLQNNVLENLEEATLIVDPEVKTITFPCRKLPIAITNL